MASWRRAAAPVLRPCLLALAFEVSQSFRQQHSIRAGAVGQDAWISSEALRGSVSATGVAPASLLAVDAAKALALEGRGDGFIFKCFDEVDSWARGRTFRDDGITRRVQFLPTLKGECPSDTCEGLGHEQKIELGSKWHACVMGQLTLLQIYDHCMREPAKCNAGKKEDAIDALKNLLCGSDSDQLSTNLLHDGKWIDLAGFKGRESEECQKVCNRCKQLLKSPQCFVRNSTMQGPGAARHPTAPTVLTTTLDTQGSLEGRLETKPGLRPERVGERDPDEDLPDDMRLGDPPHKPGSSGQGTEVAKDPEVAKKKKTQDWYVNMAMGCFLAGAFFSILATVLVVVEVRSWHT